MKWQRSVKNAYLGGDRYRNGLSKVLGLIREDWSPKQIGGYLKKQENIVVSHEIGYKWIRQDKLNGGELYKHCRHKLKHRKDLWVRLKTYPTVRVYVKGHGKPTRAGLVTSRWIP